MLKIIFLLFLYVSAAEYKKLSKYSSVKVQPDTRVYLDISSYKTGDTLKFEFSLDLFLSSNRDSYSFQMDQTSSTSYYDDNMWNTLTERTSNDLSCDSSKYCTAKYQTTKKAGANLIFIIPQIPNDFPKYWNNEIKVAQTGGLTAGAIAGVVIGCIAGAVILIIIMYYCCCRDQPKPEYTQTNPTVPLTYTQPVVQPVITPVQPVIQPVQPVIQPAVPTYYPPPNQPYYPPTAVY